MVIVYMRAGALCVCRPAKQEHVAALRPEVADMSKREFLQWIIAKDVPADATDVQILRAEIVEPELKRAGRNAWDKTKLDEFAQKDRDRGPPPDLDTKPTRGVR